MTVLQQDFDLPSPVRGRDGHLVHAGDAPRSCRCRRLQLQLSQLVVGEVLMEPAL